MKKMFLAAVLGVAALAVSAGPALAFGCGFGWFNGGSCNRKCGPDFCVRQHNAFSPICSGPIYCDGLYSLGGAGFPGAVRPWPNPFGMDPCAMGACCMGGGDPMMGMGGMMGMPGPMMGMPGPMMGMPGPMMGMPGPMIGMPAPDGSAPMVLPAPSQQFLPPPPATQPFTPPRPSPMPTANGGWIAPVMPVGYYGYPGSMPYQLPMMSPAYMPVR